MQIQQSFLFLLSFFFISLLCQFLTDANKQYSKELWFQSNHFACQCFCMVTEFEIDSRTRVAVSVGRPSFGYGVDAVPLRDEDDLSYWLQTYRKRQLIHYIKFNGSPSLREFSSGFVVNAPPSMSMKERQLFLNKLSGGQYHQIKEQFEASGDIRYLKQMKEIERIHEISFHGQNQLTKEVYISQDTKHYTSLHKKIFKWKRHCHRVCQDVVKQKPKTLHFKRHQEFAFLKYLQEPFDQNSWISAEPIHEGELDLGIPLRHERVILDQKKSRWAKRIKSRFEPLFRGMRTGHHGKLVM